jgi:hypothetical protein
MLSPIARTNTELFYYPNFSSTSGLNLVSCSTIGNSVYLTPNTDFDAGNVWRSTTLKFNKSFQLFFNFECSGGTGADGFTVQWHTNNTALGGLGGNCARINESSCIHAIVFSTLGNSIYWYKNNVSQTNFPPSIGLRQNLFYWLDYNHLEKKLKIYYNTSNSKSILRHTLNSFEFDAGDYYLGFGAGTGAVNDNHILRSMYLFNTYNYS